MRASWRVKCLAKFESQLSRDSGDPMPDIGFIASLLCIYDQQVASPAALAIYVPSLLKRKLLEVWIFTGCMCTELICDLLSGPALLLAVKNPRKFLTVKIFCNSPANILSWLFLFWGFCLLLSFPAITSSAALIFNTNTHTHRDSLWIFCYCFSPGFPCSSPLEVSPTPQDYRYLLLGLYLWRIID